MSLTDRFLRWYQRYITEITWFLIGNLTLQVTLALEKHDPIEALWCVFIIWINYAIWKRNQ